jgi:Tol biopolymer transport system component
MQAAQRHWAPWPRMAACLALPVAVAAVAVAALTGRGEPPPSLPQRAAVLLVYSAPVDEGLRSVVYAAQPSGESRRKLAVGSSPLISPDGRWVAYVGGTRERPGVVRLISSSGGRSTRLGAGSPAAWSPDSRSLVIASGERAVVRDIASRAGATVRLPQGASGFSFSPDGRSLVFEVSSEAGRDVATMPVVGGPVRMLTDDGRSGQPLWGHAGIAFWRADSGAGDVWLMDEDGSRERRLTRTDAGIYPAAWSADGRRLLAAAPARDNGALFAVDLDAGRTRPLTGFIGGLFAQGLSRDGRTVLAAIGCGATSSRIGVLVTMPFDGGERTVISRGPCRGNWNA